MAQRDRGPSIPDETEAIIEELNQNTERLTGKRSVTVIATENMTAEDRETALMEGFIKEGYSPNEAAAKAKEWIAISELMFDKPTIQ